MPYLHVNNIDLHYEITGEGYPFIFLHGLGNDCRQTMEMYSPEENIQCIYPDQRGHGSSSCDENISFDALTDDVMALADHLGLENFIIGGISMGAAASIHTYLQHPDRIKALILIRNAWAGEAMNRENTDLFTVLSSALKENSQEKLQESEAYRIYYSLDSETALSMMNFFRDQAALKYPEKFARIPAESPFETLDSLKAITVSTLILANRQDNIHPFHSSELIHEAIKDSVFREIACKRYNRDQYYKNLSVCINEFLSSLNL
jgi:pimeloyl-ACP methyl ester carboxylesterase